MSCARCGGLMVFETMCGFLEAQCRGNMNTARCLNCGNFEDAIIRANRINPRKLETKARYRRGTNTASEAWPDWWQQAM